MKNKLIQKIGISLFVIFSIFACEEPNLEELANNSVPRNSNARSKQTGSPLMSISYDMETSRDFKEELSLQNFSFLDLANMNPTNEKQHVSMELFEDGTLNMVIEELEFKQKIKSPHNTLPDDSPKIVKTEITGNTISFYDKKGALLNSEPIDMPSQTQMVADIKELGKNVSLNDINNTIATMQGQQFAANLETFIANAAQNGVQILEQGEDFVTMRMPMSTIDPKIQEETVLLIDKKKNRVVANRIYGVNNELLQSSYFGYNTGTQEYLTAIKQEGNIVLPSGKTATLETNSKIDNFNFSLNP